MTFHSLFFCPKFRFKLRATTVNTIADYNFYISIYFYIPNYSIFSNTFDFQKQSRKEEVKIILSQIHYSNTGTTELNMLILKGFHDRRLVKIVAYSAFQRTGTRTM